MGLSFIPVFNRKGLKNKSGLYSIHIRVTINRESRYLNPKLPKIKKEFWNGKQNKWVKETHPGSFEINSLIQKQLAELDKFVLRLKLFNRPIGFEPIISFFNQKGDGTIFNDYLDEYIKNIRGLNYRTVQVYKSFQKHLDKFNSQVKFAELNEELVDKFKDYLMNEVGLKGAATKKYFDKFIKVCKEAEKDGYLDISQNPFTYYSPKIKVEKPVRIYLEIEEVKKIKNLSFKENKKSLEKHRDMFLFQIYSGMYYSAVKLLKKDNLHKNELGLYIVDRREKTSNRFIIPLYKFSNSIEIINRYSAEDSEFVFPNLISEQKYNDALKEIGKLAKINKKLSNKTGRHTNAQLWMAMGIERQFLSKMFGHTKESTTQEYYDMSIHNINSKVMRVDFEALKI